MTDIIGAGIAFPLTTDRRGGLALAAGEHDVDQAIGIILGTAPGERPMRPEFGCGAHDYVFETIDAYTLGRVDDAIRVALDRWEPRIDVVDIAFDRGGAGMGPFLIEIRPPLRATNDEPTLVVPFSLSPGEEES